MSAALVSKKKHARAAVRAAVEGAGMVGGEKAHAVFGASNSDRWLACPGSVALIEQAPPAIESGYAKEGTTAHECLEFLLRNRKNLSAAILIARKKYPENMIIHAEMAIKYVEKRLAENPGAELFIEVKAELPVEEPGQFGTADIVIADHFGKLIVIDYKYGQGIPVSPGSEEDGENPQLVYYALGVAAKFDYNFSEVELVVIQPRAQVDGEFIRSYPTTMERLEHWRNVFNDGIKAAKEAKERGPEKYLFAGNPGDDHCRFCPARVICPELKTKAFNQAQIDFTDVEETGLVAIPTVAAVKGLEPARVSKMLKAFPLIEKFIEAVREHAFEVAKRGTPIEGFKVVNKRATRKWTDVDEVTHAVDVLVGDKGFTEPELLSPAQLEKVSLTGLKAKQKAAIEALIEEYTTSESSGLTLVPESDKRPAVSSAADDFADDIEIPPATTAAGKRAPKKAAKKISKR